MVGVGEKHFLCSYCFSFLTLVKELKTMENTPQPTPTTAPPLMPNPSLCYDVTFNCRRCLIKMLKKKEKKGRKAVVYSGRRCVSRLGFQGRWTWVSPAQVPLCDEQVCPINCKLLLIHVRRQWDNKETLKKKRIICFCFHPITKQWNNNVPSRLHYRCTFCFFGYAWLAQSVRLPWVFVQTQFSIRQANWPWHHKLQIWSG